MNYQEVISFVRENPVCAIATTEGDQPRVRLFLAVLFDGDDRIYFSTGSMKKVHAQIVANKKIELCFWKPDYSLTLRITGNIEIVDDRAKKQKLLDEREYLKAFNSNADDPRFVLLRVPHGSASYWSMESNMREGEADVVTF